MIRLILCDDHEIVRKGLRQLLQEQSGIEVLSDVASGEALLKELHSLQPDVVVLDISLPGRGGLEILKQIIALYPGIKTLILSMYSEDQFAIRMIRAGASGYLHKDSSPDTLVKAIRMIAAGGKYLSETMTARLFDEIAAPKRNLPLHELLSDREYEVLLLLSEGMKISDIAEKLSLSTKTISTYKARIFSKLDIQSILEIGTLLKDPAMSQPA